MSEVEILRELTVVERFRESHHAVAMMFASGMTPSMIRQRTGMSQRRLTLLSADPAFQELIAVKARRRDELFEKNQDAYLDLGMTNMIASERMVNDRINDADEGLIDPIPLMTLNRLSMDRADRFGYGKNSTVLVKHDFGDLLDKAIARSSLRVIEGGRVEPRPVLAQHRSVVAPEAPVVESSPRRGPPSISTVLNRNRKLG